MSGKSGWNPSLQWWYDYETWSSTSSYVNILRVLALKFKSLASVEMVRILTIVLQNWEQFWSSVTNTSISSSTKFCRSRIQQEKEKESRQRQHLYMTIRSKHASHMLQRGYNTRRVQNALPSALRQGEIIGKYFPARAFVQWHWADITRVMSLNDQWKARFIRTRPMRE